MLLVCALCASGCAQPPDPSVLGYDAAAARAFQRAQDETLGGPVSPLTAVAAFYIEPESVVTLGLRDGAVTRDPTPDSPTVRIVGHGETVEITRPDRTVASVDATALLELDRFTLAVAPQSGGARVIVHDPEAPARRGFQGRPWFPVDASFIVTARFSAEPPGVSESLPTTRGLTKSMARAGVLSFSIGGSAASLTAFEAEPGVLLVPFTDQTNGAQSYPVGRYVSVKTPQAGPYTVIDFNRATHPSCAYSEHYNCPVPPRDNGLQRPITAGERIDPGTGPAR